MHAVSMVNVALPLTLIKCRYCIPADARRDTKTLMELVLWVRYVIFQNISSIKQHNKKDLGEEQKEKREEKVKEEGEEKDIWHRLMEITCKVEKCFFFSTNSIR